MTMHHSFHLKYLLIVYSLALVVSCDASSTLRRIKKGGAISMMSPELHENIAVVSQEYGKDSQVKAVQAREKSTKAWSNEASCGRKVITTTRVNGPRIVNGTDAEKGEWPWQAMILQYSRLNGGFGHTCGGSLINKQWILTAAHCFESAPVSDTIIVLGAHFYNITEPSVKVFAVSSIICHRWYVGNVNSYQNDICLVKLAGSVIYTDYIIPVCLPGPDDAAVIGETCVITGWGDTLGTGSNALLQKADVGIISKALCQSWYGSLGITLPVNHFCAGYREGNIDSCQGDSGGPVSCSSGTLTYTVKGLTSFGVGCAVKKRPGAYTEVSRYMDWIEETTSNSSEFDQCFDSNTIHPCGAIISENGTIFRTPAADEETWLYPNNSSCYWDIMAPENLNIQLEFLCFFHVESNINSLNSCYDYISVTSVGADVDFIYCGSRLPKPYTINSNKTKISFHSDSSIQAAGFVIRVNFLGNLTVEESTTTITTTSGNLAVNKSTTPITTTSSNSSKIMPFYFKINISILIYFCALFVMIV